MIVRPDGVPTGEELMGLFLDKMLPLPYKGHYRPDWLCNPDTGCNLELDRYYPQLKVGFEFQGDQHYRSTDLNSGYTQRNDRLKRALCEKAGVEIIEVKAIDLQASRMLHKIKRARRHYMAQHAGQPTPDWLKPLPVLCRSKLRGLEKRAAAYRAYLRTRFPASVTVRLPKKAAQTRKLAWIDKAHSA